MNFVLVNDAVSANFIRSELASSGELNTKVGNFQALLEVLSELWILPKPEDVFSQILQQNALRMKEAFWADSIQVDEQNVNRQLEHTVHQILNFLPAGDKPKRIENPQSRQQSYYNYLVALVKSVGSFPIEQQIVANWHALSERDSLDITPLLHLFKPGITRCNL